VREGGDSPHADVCGMGRELAHKAKDANSSMSPSGLPALLGFISVYIQAQSSVPIAPYSGKSLFASHGSHSTDFPYLARRCVSFSVLSDFGVTRPYGLNKADNVYKKTGVIFNFKIFWPKYTKIRHFS